MDESSQGSVELIEGVEMVTPHGEKLRGTMREEYMQQPCIDIHRVSGGSPGGTLLTTDLMQGHMHPQMVEEFTTHGGTEYYEHHILQEHDLGDADRQLVELAVVEEPQNLTAPVTVVGEKGEIAAMLSAYIQTTGDITGTHQIIIDSSDRSVKMFQQQRLPSLSSLPPLKKALPNSTIRSRYLRHQPHHALDEEVTLTPMTTHHTLDGTNVIVGQHIVHEDAVEGHRLLATTDAEGHTILVEDPITQKILQESVNQHRIITHDNQRILVTHDSSMSHNLATSTGGHRIATSINGHRLMDVQTDHTTRYITHQEASVVTTMSGQRLITHPAQVQTQTEMDVAERLLDEESPEHQMLVQEQLIHVVLDQNAQAELGVVVPTPGQRVLLQGPEGWTTLDPAGSCEPETTDHDSRDTATIVEIQDHQGLTVKHEEIDLAESMVEEVEGLDGSVDGVAEGSDGDAAVDDGVEDSDYDGEGDMRTSRRSLPHKKRLSKKLRNPRKPQPQPLPKSVNAKSFKCNKCAEQFPTQAAYAAHRVTHNVSSKKSLSFSCEICGKMLANQLKFFEHLKAHYEPGSGVLVIDPSSSANGLVSMENGSAHEKLADGNVNENTVLKDNTHRGHQHIVQHQHHPKQEQLQQHNLHAVPEQEASQSPNHHQVPQQHIQRHVPRLLSHQVRRHHEEPMEEEHQVDMQTMVLKVESEKPHISMQQQQHLVQMPQLQNGRMRSVKNEQENLQTIQHHQRTPHHSSQTSRQSTTHQSQSSLQQSVLNSDPPPLVPILPPVSTITGSLNLSCHLCGKNFRRQKTLETHLSIAHPKQEDIEQFSDPEDMMEGIREVVEAGEGSDEDSQSMVRLTTLTTHSADSVDKSHSDSWYRDDDISATEADLQALQHAENEQRNQGHIQHEGNSHQQQAATQLEVAHMCDLCGDAFHSKARLNQHLRVEHMELRQKGKDKAIEDDDDYPKGKKLRRLACNQCDRVFNHRNSLVYHLRSHSGERPHQCEECGKSFFATSALKVHMRLHSGDKPYKCEFCGRNFRQWGDLKYHCTSRHSEEKQYQCEYCGKDFARKYSLIVHRRIHTGEKDYVCEFCQKKFRASSYLQNHRRIHTGEKPHRCEICDKPFRVRSDMKRHLNTHNRERQRLSGGANANRANKQVEEVDEAEVDAPDSQDHMHQNLHIHELDNATTITVMKTDSEGAMEILPDDPSSQGATTISLSAHSTDAGLQYASDRDTMDSHHRSHSGSAQTSQLVYVLPTSYYM
ncbi:zinc finger protein 473-like isoform X2 [Thrips palmi]|uniref:Zinc finger protein 473-like isoform X2 n=1 Tax=Thrips palmi TaxID=161013 RepID=A0A6P8YSN3_THRPL|nr:zinc finger protein 473-like isoform X2 [Thrips palmi]